MMLRAKIVIRPSAPPREHVEHAEQSTGLLFENLTQNGSIDPRNWDIGAKPIDDQRTQREPDALFQFGRLGKGAEIDITR